MKSKITFTLLAAVLNCGIAVAQIPDTTQIKQIYQQWESTVVNKQASQHLGLYLYPQAQVYVIKKQPSGAQVLATVNAANFANTFSQPTPYQLDISDVNVIADSSFAITDARFDEYYNNNYLGYGRDMFGYIKTNAGWKLLFLHNTFIDISDSTDYSVPLALPNSVENVLDGFTTYFNSKNGVGLAWLFVSNQNPAIVFHNVLDSNFTLSGNTINDFAQIIHNSVFDRTIQFSNISIHYVDQYLASVFCNYEIMENTQTSESGRAWFNLMADMNNGWRLTSFVRNTNSTTVLSIRNENATVFGYKLYPNPVNGIINLDFNNVANGDYQVEIINQLGQQVYSENLNSSVNHHTINAEIFSNGIYFLKLSDGLRSETKKLIIQN
ncbi:MAG: T9SS type A sorting domain-containing protein [Bacteroidetes bacterium]|nr:T9SS type A sorting domain-containing protein [Bacteroidota bacterium]